MVVAMPERRAVDPVERFSQDRENKINLSAIAPLRYTIIVGPDVISGQSDRSEENPILRTLHGANLVPETLQRRESIT